VPLGAFVKFNWFGILGIFGIIIGIIGLMLSYYYYKMTTAPPEPVFLLDPTRTIIVDSKQFFETPLRVVRPSGDEIEGDITSVRFYFWNNGRKSIKTSNILEPLVITLDDPKGEILDYKILKCSRKVVKPVVERNSVEPKRSLDLSFSILEPEDGFTCQVIYAGNPDAGLTISGIVENVRTIITTTELIRSYFWKDVGGYIKFPTVTMLGFIVIFTLHYVRLSNEDPTLIIREKMKQSFGASWIWFLMTVLLLVLLYPSIKKAREKAPNIVIQKVPKNIIP